MAAIESVCPGCALEMPRRPGANYEGDYNTSRECWEVYTEVLEREFSNALLFGQVHQTTVDTYAVQHAGGNHRDKSVAVHLCGLYLVLERAARPTAVPPLLQRLAARVRVWPHFPPPPSVNELTVFDVGLAESREDHVRLVREWAKSVWLAWSLHHGELGEFVARHLD
jgi:hypothetical protein